MPSAFQSFDCPLSTKRWRYLDDGRIEIEGEGTPTMTPWPEGVNSWRGQIERAAAKYSVPAAWVASTMAQETGGRNVCLNAHPPPSICGPGCSCVQNEGAGLMAMLPSTATMLAGRTISSQMLMADPELAVDLGAKLLRRLLDQYGGDYVRAAVAYNAGSVRCGRGGTFRPSGSDWPKAPCPDTGWGVVFGCVWANKKYGPHCFPSGHTFKPYICSTIYPQKAIEAQNASRHHFEGIGPSPIGPGPQVPEVIPGLGPWGLVAVVVGGTALGYAAMEAAGAFRR